MSVFKGTAYAGQMKMGYGGFHKQSTQPKSAWTSEGKSVGSNMGAMGNPPPKRGALLGPGKFKPTCKSCGGKM